MKTSIMEWAQEKSAQQAITAFHDDRARTGLTGKHKAEVRNRSNWRTRPLHGERAITEVTLVCQLYLVCAKWFSNCH
jgi:hypothetical protein